MKIYLAADHTGVELKNIVKETLQHSGHEVIDCGAYEYHANDDYPDFIKKAAQAVSLDPISRGIIFGGSGQGEAIVANKYKNVRCALFYALAHPTTTMNIEGEKSEDPFTMIRLTREHNAANMLSIGARFVNETDALTAIKLWLETPDPTEERHIRRIKKIEN
jgi:ribose 5-phosphate isomerase B